MEYEYYESLQHELEDLRRERMALLEALSEAIDSRDAMIAESEK